MPKAEGFDVFFAAGFSDTTFFVAARARPASAGAFFGVGSARPTSGALAAGFGFGGRFGVRDDNAIESALARARQQWAYAEHNDLASLAAAYGYGLTRNHGYVDGNKRIAFLAMMMFLRLNKVPFAPGQAQATAIMLSLAAGETSEEAMTRWIRDNWPIV